MNVDWVIIGGGIHGVHLAARLVDEAGVPRESIRIVDEHSRLLDRWKECTSTTGMTHLRSPAVHHLELNPWSLLEFAGKKKSRKKGLFAPPYNRPSLQLFNSHCDQLIQRLGLDELHIQARATKCEVGCDTVGVELSNGNSLQAQQVVLAMGNSEETDRPEWVPESDSRVRHIFEVGQDLGMQDGETCAVVGGGISACQVALRLAGEGHEVHLVSRHALREHQFDSDPGWLGPKYMAGFEREQDVSRRRAMIARARHKGSVPPDVLSALNRAARKGKIHLHEAHVEELDTEGKSLELRLSTEDLVRIDRVFLATGFTTRRPGGRLVDELIASHSFPCSGCGYPLVDDSLRWHPRVFVAGPLAELELGPTARNISGARRAGERLVKAVQNGCLVSTP